MSGSGPLGRLRRGFDGAGSLYPLAVVFGLNAVDELDASAFAVLLPNIAEDFGVDTVGIGGLLALVVAVNLVLGLGLAYLADRRSRLRIAQGGALAWAGFSTLTGLAPNIGVLTVARIGSGLGKSVNGPTHESLIADWYPASNRAAAYSVYRMANSVGQLVGPLLAGALAWWLGWRAPFVLFAVPTAVFVVLSLRLHDPLRGVHERRQAGGDERLAAIEDAPPGWEESWRILGGIRTLRRIWRALPFLVGGILAIGFLRNLYYEEIFGVGELGRGALEASNEPFQLLGLAVGIPVATRLVRSDPVRLFTLIAAAATVAAAGFVVFAAAPTLPVAVVSSMVITFAVSIVVPGITTLQSLIIPPRARSFGLSVGRLWALPGLVSLLVVGGIADTWGMRAGILVMVPVFLLGGYILASAGTQVRADMRSAELAALAAAEFRDARERGTGKLLVCRGVDVHYGLVQVLFGVDFDVADGEIVALLGTNGAGKSTLLKAIAGAIDPSGGAVVFDGADITYASAQQTLSRGLVYMPGGRAVFPTLTVEENLRAAAWVRHGDPDLAEDLQRVLEMFPVLRDRHDQPAGNLSGGEQQMLALSMAFLARPRLLMIDELSLGLAPAIVQDLLAIVRRIHARGTTVVVVEQSVNVALSIADRAVFLEKGEVRFEGRTADLLERADILRSVFLRGAAAVVAGATPAARVPSRAGGAASDGSEPAGTVLEVRGLVKSFGGIRAVRGVDLTVRRGEIVGLIGPNGAGKTTVFDLISGYLAVDAGTVRFRGVDVTGWSPDARARAGLGRSFQDARLFPSLTVREVLACAHHRHLRSRDLVSAAVGLPDQRIEEQLLAHRVDQLIEVMGLEAFADKFVGELSTGSRRIVDIACALAHQPDVLLLDEPSSGIAQRETEALGPLLTGVRDALGTSLLVIEHDMPLITSVSDRLVALDLGAVIAEGEPEAVVEHPAVVASYLGTDPAAVHRSGSAFRGNGSRRLRAAPVPDLPATDLVRGGGRGRLRAGPHPLSEPPAADGGPR